MIPINKSVLLTPPKALHPRAKKCIQSSSVPKFPIVSSVSSCSAGRHRPFHFCSNSSLLTFLWDESYKGKELSARVLKVNCVIKNKKTHTKKKTNLFMENFEETWSERVVCLPCFSRYFQPVFDWKRSTFWKRSEIAAKDKTVMAMTARGMCLMRGRRSTDSVRVY